MSRARATLQLRAILVANRKRQALYEGEAGARTRRGEGIRLGCTPGKFRIAVAQQFYKLAAGAKAFGAHVARELLDETEPSCRGFAPHRQRTSSSRSGILLARATALAHHEFRLR